jgi:hypothetical protein
LTGITGIVALAQMQDGGDMATPPPPPLPPSPPPPPPPLGVIALAQTQDGGDAPKTDLTCFVKGPEYGVSLRRQLPLHYHRRCHLLHHHHLTIGHNRPGQDIRPKTDLTCFFKGPEYVLLQLAHLGKTATVVTLQDVKSEYQQELTMLVSAVKANL